MTALDLGPLAGAFGRAERRDGRFRARKRFLARLERAEVELLVDELDDDAPQLRRRGGAVRISSAIGTGLSTGPSICPSRSETGSGFRSGTACRGTGSSRNEGALPIVSVLSGGSELANPTGPAEPAAT